ncbi:MAG: hypothetical protein AAFU49_12955 [Pseudomonadota bacterium]
MSLSTTDQVHTVFYEATKQALTKHLRTGEDFQRFATIAREAEARIAAEQVDFREHYPTRLAEAREVILREKTGQRLDKPRPRNAPHISDQAVLDHHADARVRHDHQRRIEAIKSDELHELALLRQDIFKRDAPDPVHGRSFSRSPTRSGPSRD